MGNVTSCEKNKEVALRCCQHQRRNANADTKKLENGPAGRQNKHYASIFLKLNEMRATAHLTDVQIHHGDLVFSCHAIVLMCRSSFFYKELTRHYETALENASEIVSIHEDGMKADVIEDLLNFIYLGKISIPKQRLVEYSDAARKWDLQYIRSCQKVTVGHYVHRSSTSGIFTTVFTAEELLSQFIDVIEKDFEESVKEKFSVYCPQFLKIPGKNKILPNFNFRLVTENGADIHCHREVLASFSSYFYAMLATSFKESTDDRVILQGTNASVLLCIVRFMYSSTVSFTYESAKSIAAVAGWLCHESDLFDLAEQFLMKSLSFLNCVELMQFSEMHALDNLHKQSAILAYNNLKCTSPTLNDLPKDLLCYYLSSDELSVSSEREVFDALDCWAFGKHKEIVYDAFKLVVRLSLFRAVEIENLVNLSSGNRKSRLTSSLLLCDNVKRDLLRAHRHALKWPLELRMSHCKQSYRKSHNQSVLIVTVDRPQLRQNTKFYIYNVDSLTECNNNENKQGDFTMSLQHCCMIKHGTNFNSFATAVFDNCLYITGGTQSTGCMNATLIYRPSTTNCHSWIEGPHLLTARYGHCTIAAGDSLYVLGGFSDRGKFVKSVERLKYSKQAWIVETTMLANAPNLVCAAFNDILYVFCMSTRGRAVYASLHCYSTKLQDWLQPTLLGFTCVPTPMCFTNAIIFDERIYVFADILPSRSSTMISIFDPSDDSWYPNHCEIAGSGKPFVRNGHLFLCKSCHTSDDLRWSPYTNLLDICKVETSEKYQISSATQLSYKLPSSDASGFDWNDAVKMLHSWQSPVGPDVVSMYSKLQ